MGNSTTQLDQISSTQSNKELLMNGLTDALSPSSLYGRRASSSNGLTWGYYGGAFNGNQIANGTVTLTASTTNYVVANTTTGAVSVSTTAPTSGLLLYTVVTGTTTVTSYTDNRQALGGGGAVPDTSIQWSIPDILGGFVDGNLDSWQGGTSFSLSAATDTYTADMWICNAGSGGAASVSQSARTLGSEPSYLMRPSKYQLQYQQTTAATSSPTIGQKLESVLQFNGQSITVQVSAVGSGSVVGVQATQNFGTGGSPSAPVVTSKAVSWSISSTESRYSVRLDIPSVAGKTLGTNGNDFLRVDFLLATGATFSMSLCQFQTDICPSTASSNTTGSGGLPRPFRFGGAAAELSRVRRYVKVLDGFLGLCTTYNSTNAFGGFNFERMRAAPAYVLMTSVSNLNFFSPATGNIAPSSVTVNPNSAGSGTLVVVISGGVAGQAGYLTGNVSPTYLADARL
ncbi:hypothetical protein [Burkholderia gladioli]|uniref:hypothetical protein n=1 Tax=Burkholderia gladioli TaxID=28095 RepID=UPI00163F1231|nr:hypothetical protein [Burkholderia gladioli]